MQSSGIPEFLVRINAGLVPPVELIVGALITVGFLTRSALIACFILMIILMYGITMIQNWDGASSQLIYQRIGSKTPSFSGSGGRLYFLSLAHSQKIC